MVHSTKLLESDWTRAVQLIPNCTLRNKHEVFLRHRKISEVDPKSTEDLRGSPEDFGNFRRLCEVFQRFPKSPEDFRSWPEDFPRWSEVFRRFSKFRCSRLSRSLSKILEVRPKSFRGFWSKHEQRKYKAYRYRVLIDWSRFCENVINKKSQDLLVKASAIQYINTLHKSCWDIYSYLEKGCW